jgi:hypothetical protein
MSIAFLKALSTIDILCFLEKELPTENNRFAMVQKA